MSRAYGIVRQGFTVVEVLAVMVVIALAGLFAGLEIYQRLGTGTMESSTQGLLQMAGYAQLWSAEYHRRSQLHINIAKNTYCLTVTPEATAVGGSAARGVGADAKVLTKAAEPVTDSSGVATTRLPGGGHGMTQRRSLPEGVRFGLVRVAGPQQTDTAEVTIAFEPNGSADAGLIQIVGNNEVWTILIYPWSGRAELISHAVSKLPTDMIGADR